MRAGYSRDEIRNQLRSGRWTKERRGIFRPAGEVDRLLVASAAAVLACVRTPAAASHASAARRLGIPLVTPGGRVEVTLPPNSRTTSVKGCIVHHAPLAGWTTVVEGLRVTSTARTAVDLARTRPFADGVAATDHVLRGEVDAEELARAARPLRGYPGHLRVQRVLDFADGGSASVGESLARVAFAEQRLPPPRLGQALHHDGELLGVVDFLWPEHRTVGEFDGRVKYLPDNAGGPDRLWQEKLREERLRDAGYEVVRLTWQQVTHEPAEVAARVRAAFARSTRSAPRAAPYGV